MAEAASQSGGRSHETLTWRAGHPLVYGAPKEAGFDVRVSVEFAGEKLSAASAFMLVRMTPTIRCFFDGTRDSLEVQSFRYLRADGHAAMFLYCGSCAHTLICAETELGEAVEGKCPGCGSGLSAERCCRWHAWGECNKCPRFGFKLSDFRPPGWKPDAAVAKVGGGA